VRIGDNRFGDDLHTYRIHATVEEIAVDVTLVGQVPAWRPATGYLLYGAGRDKESAWLPRRVRPCCRGLWRAAATPRRGTLLPQHQREPSQALRGHGRPARKRRRGHTTQPEVHEKLAPYHSAVDLPIVLVLARADATSLTAVADAAAP
jgi:hypothetical protein